MPKKLVSVSVLIIVLLLFVSVTKPVLADEIVFQDDFSGDLHQWQQLRGLSDDWHIVDGQLEASINNSYTISELVPTDSVWQHSWQNIKYSLDYTPLEGADRNISFNVLDVNHWYEVHFVDGDLNIVKMNNGVTPFTVDFPANVVLGQTYHIDIIFHTGLVQVYVDSHLIAEQYDWTFTGEAGKIGVKITTGSVFPTRVRFDNISVTQITSNGESLAVPILKQTDPIWASEIYDDSSTWSKNPTIGNLGCALTSMVMVMQYHGLHFMPDGQELTPSTLNTWLENEPDGYLGESLVNWLAITRLTKKISEQYQTVALEYTYQPVFDVIAAAVTQLEQKQPAVIEIPEYHHFVAAIGYTGNHQDLYINDPYNSYTKLSFYQAQNMTGRFFKPSHTDLSYIEITHSPNIDIRLTSANQIQVQTETETLGGENGDLPAGQLVTELVAKPVDGTYVVQILRRDYEAYKIKVFAYSQDGSVVIQDLSAPANTQPFDWTIHFTKQNPSMITADVTLEDFEAQLHSLAQANGFSRLSVYYRLLFITHLSLGAAPNLQNLYLHWLQTEVSDLSYGIHKSGLTNLNQTLTALIAGRPP